MRSQAVCCMFMPSSQWKMLYRLCPNINASVVFSSKKKQTKQNSNTEDPNIVFRIYSLQRRKSRYAELDFEVPAAFICSLVKRNTCSCENCVHDDICIILFILAQKIMHTRKRHQDMFQDLNRKLQHAEKDRESPPVDSKPGKRWSVSSGGSDKTNLSVSILANLFFNSLFLSVTLVLLISLPGWRNIRRLSPFLVWCVSGEKYCFNEQLTLARYLVCCLWVIRRIVTEKQIKLLIEDKW